jgi:hypothetical protein
MAKLLLFSMGVKGRRNGPAAKIVLAGEDQLIVRKTEIQSVDALAKTVV